jgi:hypothetical protein
LIYNQRDVNVAKKGVLMNCPTCKGEGGDYEAVLWHGVGGGPYYECNYCTGSGVVSLAKFLYWHIIVIFWEEVIPKFWRNLTKRSATTADANR